MSAAETRAAMQRVRRALEAVAAGQMVVVTDDPARENEADLIMAAEMALPEDLACMIRHGSGIVCVALAPERAAELALPPMVAHNTDPNGTAFTISVDAEETSTGVSAEERAFTITALADPQTRALQLRRPGHVFPLVARRGGILARGGHTEAAFDLARLAGRAPAGVLCELTNDDGTMIRGPQVRRFAAERGLHMLSIEELAWYRSATETLVEQVASADIPTRHGTFASRVFRSLVDGQDHIALTMGDVADGEPVLTRVHSECLTGDALGSLRCDCGDQLDAAMARIGHEGRGAIVYLRGHEGRGIGLASKIKAYELQERGYDTVEANVQLGLPVDARDYGIAAQILRCVGAGGVRLLTNNPAKLDGLDGLGVRVVERVPLHAPARQQNITYLQTKRERMGHLLRVAPTMDSDADSELLDAVAETCWP
jgi:3,4-dihydroxy 2-butanone 4-phosphate synthase/GTP cyclohydrolase II